ncbi:MAG: hypothetical protein QF704_09710 [Anaerolineales bacterium]|nr:hypothetical protein [Anaerolineales bacterium]
MTEEIIRYGAGGKPYKGQIGPHSTDVEATPEAPEETPAEEPKVSVEFVEDDTPVTDEELEEKTKGGE